MKESDLFPLVKRLFTEDGQFTVYGEVRRIDVVALNDERVIGIELKKNLSFHVIEQAVNNKKYVDASYVAVPKPKRIRSHQFAHRVLKKFNIGLIYVLKTKAVIHFAPPKKNHPTRNIRTWIEPHHTLTTGGAKSGATITASQLTMIYVYNALFDRNWHAFHQFAPSIPTHYKGKYPTEQLKTALKAPWNAHWLEWEGRGKTLRFRIRPDWMNHF